MSVLAVAAAVSVMAGAAVQSAVGFGFALVAAPLLYAAAPSPEQAVGLLILLGLEVNLLTLLAERRRPHPSWADAVAVVAWSLPGALAVNLRARPHAQAPPRAWWARPAAGVAAGALNTSTSTGGPPVVLLLMGRGLPPRIVRDTLTTAFIGFAAVSSAALALTGTEEAVPGTAWVAALVPAAAAGQLAGRPLFARLAGGRAYQRILPVVLLVTVAAGLATVAL